MGTTKLLFISLFCSIIHVELPAMTRGTSVAKKEGARYFGSILYLFSELEKNETHSLYSKSVSKFDFGCFARIK